MAYQTYTSFLADYLASLSMKGRMRMYQRLMSLIEKKQASLQNILDVGATGNTTRLDSNYFEKLYEDKSKITALSNQSLRGLKELYPAVKTVKGNALSLPFEENSFDLCFSSAVLEHVGSFENQKKMISELYRTSRRFVYVTTPYRYYPVELHTVTPLLHWLPKKLCRKIYKLLGYGALSKEENLNLCSLRDMKRICKELGISNYQIYFNKCFGLPSNILLFIDKKE